MKILGFTPFEIIQILTLGAILFQIVRGIVTKKDCDTCKGEQSKTLEEHKKQNEKDLSAGRRKFEEILKEQKTQGEKLSSVDTKVDGIKANVDQLVAHHIGKSA